MRKRKRNHKEIPPKWTTDWTDWTVWTGLNWLARTELTMHWLNGLCDWLDFYVPRKGYPVRTDNKYKKRKKNKAKTAALMMCLGYSIPLSTIIRSGQAMWPGSGDPCTTSPGQVFHQHNQGSSFCGNLPVFLRKKTPKVMDQFSP